MNSSLNVWVSAKPFSSDTAEFDFSTHHYIFTSLFAPLVTMHSSGEITGILADSWTVSPNATEWTFQIRKGLTFSNGDLLTPREIALSFKRMALLHLENTKYNGPLEKLIGVSSKLSINEEWKGIEVDSNKISFKFSKPMTNFIEQISFGMYGIVHPSLFDHKSLTWLDSRAVIASGAYELVKWTDENVVIALRPDNQLPGNSNRAKEIKFSWQKESKSSADITPDSLFFSDLPEGYSAKESVKNSIAYFRVLSWNNKRSLLSRSENRTFLRNLILKELEIEGLSTAKSFFPTEIVHGQVFELDNVSFKVLPDMERTLRIRVPVHFDKVAHKLFKVLERWCKSENITLIPISNLSFQEYNEQKDNPNLAQYSADIVLVYTSVSLEDPRADILFMFAKQVGIALPDITGKIKEELQKPDFSIQQINQQLWNDNIVFALAHYSRGFFYRKRVDISMYNEAFRPMDFSWIGLKN